MLVVLGEHHLFYGEFVHVHGVIATGDNFDAIDQFMPIQVHKHPTMRNMIGGNSSPKIPIIIVPKRRITTSPVQIRERIHTLQNRDIFDVVDLVEDLAHCAGGVLGVFYACYADFVDVFGGF